MLQESVYAKLALNQTATNKIYENLRRNKPPEGIVQVLSITEKQFSEPNILRKHQTEIIDSDERLIIL